ncbi:lipoprotein LpqH [Tsukamurella sp. M9C]|uniref:lipoprotein LpqH n=1 Tax=Tsukamurella sp. M9C TaxID=2877520 RepID=UPI001CC92AA1|nr:lipoprotein LpqH [Tsukamurella sp. M9C]
MDQGMRSAVVCVFAAASIAGCTTSVSGTAVPAGSGAATVAGGGGGDRGGSYASLTLDGVAPPGGDRIAVECDDVAGTLVVASGEPPVTIGITILTADYPRVETLALTLENGKVYFGQESTYSARKDGGAYIVTGDVEGFGGDVTDGTLGSVVQRFELRITC